MSDEIEKDGELNKDDQGQLDMGDVFDPAAGRIKNINIEDEMSTSYLDYAMSVIVSRALPDVRDGLKPVHRRILFAMNDLGLRSNAKFRKSATVVGEVLGKYHPHGDTAVYDSMVRMAQDFAMRYPLVNGQGNFGSVDGDSAAAMRYTESKMQKITDEMLVDIEKNTVDFQDNYDGTRQEPKVLPARIPNLLVNGTVGIAVGMATSIPPHNLTEVLDATIHLINNPEATTDDLCEFVKGPDFPTGAKIYNSAEIKEAYATGKGRVLMRAVANIEDAKGKGSKIIVTEIPYQVNKSTLIERIADLVKEKKLEGISDLRDESDREGMRIVVELKRDAYPNKILNQLYKQTALQSTFHVNTLALVNGIEPRVLTLKMVLGEFIKHRQVVITRRSEYDLAAAKLRAHILEGLIKALDHLDEVIAIIRKSKDKLEAKLNLIKKFKFTEIQTDAILEMRLHQLSRLDRTKIDDEYKAKLEIIAYLEDLLAHPEKVLKVAEEELVEIREKYGDERKTEVVDEGISSFKDEDLIPNENVIVTLTQDNYVKRVPVSTYRSQNRGGKGVMGMSGASEDQEESVAHLMTVKTHDNLLFFTDAGKVYQLKVYELPVASRTAKGQAIVNFISVSNEEKVTSIINISNADLSNEQCFLMMVTNKGVVKKTPLSYFANVRRNGIAAINLHSGDQLGWVKMAQTGDETLIVTRDGQSIRFSEKDARAMGRGAAGIRGIKLKGNDEVVGADILNHSSTKSSVLVISENGYGKKTKIDQFHLQGRGGSGVKAMQVTQKTGELVGMIMADENVRDVILISSSGQIIRLPAKSFPEIGRATQGVRVMRLRDNDKLCSLAPVKKDVVEDEEAVSGAPEVTGGQESLGEKTPVLQDESVADESEQLELEIDENVSRKPEKVVKKSSGESVKSTSKSVQSVIKKSALRPTQGKLKSVVKKPEVKKTTKPVVKKSELKKATTKPVDKKTKPKKETKPTTNKKNNDKSSGFTKKAI